MKISTDLAGRLPFEAALERLDNQRGELLPASIGQRAARAAGARYVALLRAKLVDGLTLPTAEIVFAQRHGSGSRPVADLDVDSRLILEALAMHLATILAPDRELLGLHEPFDGVNTVDKTAFEEAALDDSEAAFVAKADVSSYYEYVDHDRLSGEIVELAADAPLAYAVSACLAEIMGRRYGLPQGPHGSDVFANLYLSGVDRRLARAGVRFDRFNDDYLIRGTSLSETRRHLLSLEVELRRMGLILNHQKTQILSRAEYEEGFTALEALLSDAAIDSVDVPVGYSFDPDEFAQTDLASANQATIELAFRRAVHDDELQLEVRRRMVDAALPYLAGFGSLEPLEQLAELVERFPSHIRNLNLYLRSLVGQDGENAAIAKVDALLRSESVPVPWVQGWLVDFMARATKYAPGLVPWLRQTTVDSAAPWFLRSRALIATARAGALPAQEEVAGLLRSAPAANRPDIVAAAALSRAGWRDAFLGSFASNEPLLREIPALVALGSPVSML